MQSRTIVGIAIAIALALGLPAANLMAQSGKKIYCWNENGKKVCGDTLPASATDSARTEISAKSGIATGRVDRAPTETERAAAAEAAEAARVLALAEEYRQRRDMAMALSYDTEDDLRRAYGERTLLLDETLKAGALGLANLRLSLLSLLRQGGDLELAGKPVPKKLSESIQSQHAELLRQQQIQATQQRDRAALEQELQAAVARYREMKAPPETAASAADASGATPPATP